MPVGDRLPGVLEYQVRVEPEPAVERRDPRVDVVTARIMTSGERAEDVFYVTDEQGRQLADDKRLRLEEQLHDALDLRDAQRLV